MCDANAEKNATGVNLGKKQTQKARTGGRTEKEREGEGGCGNQEKGVSLRNV
jgi:hypothetical protein